MEKIEFFDIPELVQFSIGTKEMFLSLDVYSSMGGYSTNIIENKSVCLKDFPNTLEAIGKRYSCEKKIAKFIRDDTKFTLKVKHEKKGVFEFSVTINL